MTKEKFQRAVECYLTGKETESWEPLYFKVYRSQLPVIEQALEMAGLVPAANKSRGDCLEMTSCTAEAASGSVIQAFILCPEKNRPIRV